MTYTSFIRHHGIQILLLEGMPFSTLGACIHVVIFCKIGNDINSTITKTNNCQKCHQESGVCQIDLSSLPFIFIHFLTEKKREVRLSHMIREQLREVSLMNHKSIFCKYKNILHKYLIIYKFL